MKTKIKLKNTSQFVGKPILFLSLLTFMLSGFVVQAQKKDSTKIIQDQKKEVPLPPIKAIPKGEKEAKENPSLLQNPNPQKGMLELPERNQIQFMPKVQYRDPAELYKKRFGIKDEEALPNFVTKTYFGNFHTKGKYIEVVCRDFGAVDDDVIQISVNEKIIIPQIYLINEYRSFKVPLEPGINNVVIMAVNEGLLKPNTGEFRIFDEFGKELSANYWGLKAQQKANFVIVRME
ncbi:MAG: hypothetical protein OIF50_01110 [Flavobacteriaceae bacterium]|nr:hypothetical protein [Flavobacteriaceae bacterium]